MEQTHGGTAPGLVAQLHALAELGLRSVNTRLRLAQAELKAEKDRLFMSLIWTIAAVFLGVFGLFLGVIGLILMAPENWRPGIMIGVCILSVLTCTAIVSRILRSSHNEPDVLTETLGVLEDDALALATSPASHPVPAQASREAQP